MLVSLWSFQVRTLPLTLASGFRSHLIQMKRLVHFRFLSGGRSQGRTVMGSPGKTSDRIEALRSMLDRLCAPDLTLSEAKELVPSLSNMLDSEARSGNLSCDCALHSMSNAPQSTSQVL